MGWVLRADCDACGYTQPDLRLGATHTEIGQHDVCHRELHRATCCGAVHSVLAYMGAGYADSACERCGQPLPLDPATTRYRITTLKGERLEGHACPRCGEERLRFSKTGSFV